MSYLSQELAIREDLVEEKLKYLIEQKPMTLKTEDQEPAAESAAASDDKSIRQSVRTAVQDNQDDPDDEDPSSSTNEDNTLRSKRASGRGRPEKTSNATKKKEKRINWIETVQTRRKAPEVQRRG